MATSTMKTEDQALKVADPETGDKGNGRTLRPAVERLRKSAVLREDAQTATGINQLQALEGLDAIPNKISSVPPQTIEVRPEELWVDRRYQRSHMSRKSINLIHKIVEGWDWTKFKPPVVTRDSENRWIVIDGQHTAVAAATHPGIKTIPVMFVALKDVTEQAQSFIGHNLDRISVGQLELWHARKQAGDKLVLDAERIMRTHGVNVVRQIQGSAHVWEANQTMATGVVLRILEKYGTAKFNQIVQFISKCGLSQIRSDHWKFATALLASSNEADKIYSPERMTEVVRATHENDAFNEARRIATLHKTPTYKGLLIFYKNQYRDLYQLR